VIEYVVTFLFAIVLETGWVLAVRFVSNNQTIRLLLLAMAMQVISYVSTLLLVDNNWTMLSGTIGAGLGAVIGMKISSQRSDPKPRSRFRNSGPSCDGAYGGTPPSRGKQRLAKRSIRRCG
jgi:hypothetical protein